MAPQRVQRAAAAKAAKAIKSKISESLEDDMTQENLIVNEFVIKKPNISGSSRAFVARVIPDNPKLAKKGTRNAGKLKQLKDMPIDIFFEITSWLHPLDLLRLSRVSKYFREMFMSKSSKALWIRARRQFNGMPDCPDSISEPQYAALVFENVCQACGVSRAPKFDFVYLVRLCGACHKENVVNGKRLLRLYPKTLDPIILRLMPRECGENYYPGSELPSLADNGSIHRYYQPQFEAIANCLLTLKRGSSAYDTFIDKMKEKAETMIKCNHAIHLWLRQESREKGKDQTENIEQRKASIKAKLLEMGYKQEDFPQDYEPDWYSCLNQPRPLTTRIWKQIKDRLEACLEREKLRKRAQTLRLREHHILIQLRPHYNEVIAQLNGDTLALWVAPLVDITKILEVNSILTNFDTPIEITPQCIQHTLDTLKNDATRLRDITERRLLADLRPIFSQAADGTEVGLPELLDHSYLLRATSFFECPSTCCSDMTYRQPFTYEDILHHIREEPCNRERIGVHIPASRISKKVIRVLGLADDILAKDLPPAFICDCLNPRLVVSSTFSGLIDHLVEDRAWYDDMVENLNDNRDLSLVLHDDHDFDSSPPFVHVRISRQSTPQFEAHNWKPKRWAMQFGCKTCENISSAVTRHRSDRNRSYTFRHGMLENRCFAHHIKTKHQHDPCEEDVMYIDHYQ
ncbi:hypothetical protein QCA50_019775 [Cerrena zonata]|uniref:F-box domain-containing protein n=1 Tax=Cerrena zonata TaxID=2478898 RepID=A0AAW0FGM7_9APHY